VFNLHEYRSDTRLAPRLLSMRANVNRGPQSAPVQRRKGRP
jgi:hypothetical protein